MSRPNSMAASEADDAWGNPPLWIDTSSLASRKRAPRCRRCKHQELLPGDPAEPEEGRQRGCGQVIRRAAGDVEERLLEHVGGIDPSPEAVVDPEPDDVLQPFAVAGEQREQSLAVPLLDASLKLRHVIGLARHKSSNALPRRRRQPVGGAKLSGLARSISRLRTAAALHATSLLHVQTAT